MDKTNAYSNGISFDICKVEQSDITFCFDYNNFVNMVVCMNGDYESFKMKIAYIEESEGGLVYVLKGDEEKYFLMSKVE